MTAQTRLELACKALALASPATILQGRAVPHQEVYISRRVIYLEDVFKALGVLENPDEPGKFDFVEAPGLARE